MSSLLSARSGSANSKNHSEIIPDMHSATPLHLSHFVKVAVRLFHSAVFQKIKCAEILFGELLPFAFCGVPTVARQAAG